MEENKLHEIKLKMKCSHCGQGVEPTIRVGSFSYNQINSEYVNDDILFCVVCPQCGTNFAFKMSKIKQLMVCQ